MAYEAFLLGLLLLASPPLASSTTVSSKSIHNCSGEAFPAPLGYEPYFPSYLPQLGGAAGWEEWTFVLPDQNNQSMFHFRWTRGNPAANASDPRAGTFSVFYEKTGFRADVKSTFKSSVAGDALLSVSIGKNRLSFDGTWGPFGLWNATVDIEGLKVDALIDP